jgi:hypothetical protein
MGTIKTLLRIGVTLVIALILLFEEWGWEPLARAMARLARWRVWAWAEGWIQALPAWGALLVFLLPMLVLLPVKLLALFLFGSGHKAWGLILLLAAKLLGTAVVARLFHLTQGQLMQFAWFAAFYPRWKAWKDGLTARIRASAVWQQGRKWKALVKAQVKAKVMARAKGWMGRD